MKKIKVAHILGGTNHGGAETFVMNVFRAIDRDRFEFVFCVSDPRRGEYDDEIESLGGMIYHIKTESQGSKIKKAIVQYKERIRFFHECGPFDVVHIHTNSAVSIVDLLAAKMCKIKVRIIHSHSTNTKNRKGHLLLRPFLKFVATDFFACGTDAGIWMYGEKHVKSQKVKVVQNGINVSLYSFDSKIREKIRKEEKIPNDSFVIGHVGRFEEVKNHAFLINLFESFSCIDSSAHLVFVGNGVLYNEVLVNVEKNPIIKGKVHFLGVRDNVNEILNAFDVFVLPSFHEGLPISVIEAETNGLSVIVSENVTRDCDICNNGLFLSIKSIDPWISSIQNIKKSILNNDRNRYFEMVKKSKYNIENVIVEIEKIYTRHIM